jgi:ectoine hydroxylase-related dioxygenase (phytanoyl-CoA dioxygenase family)
MGLTAEEIRRFQTDGFLGPYELMGPEEMEAAREVIETRMRSIRGPDRRCQFESRHQDIPELYAICSSAPVVERIASLLGPDVILWNSVLFAKEPGGGEIPWHQDQEFLLLDPHINVAAWLAMTETTLENGCLDIVPESHREMLPHVPRRHRHEFLARARHDCVPRDRVKRMLMRPGEFILFHTNLLHHSGANFSTTRRVGLAMRYTIPGVRVNTQGLFDDHFVYCVRGRDDKGVNRTAPPPAQM